jgi:DNA-binding NtrC family response regulator
MRKNKILIVDDEEDIIESLRMLIERVFDDVEVDSVYSGEEALEHLNSTTPDLVISDFKMPGMTGLELLGYIHESYPRIPRILMTAFPDVQIAIDAINHAKIESFITKPIDPAEIVETIRIILDGRDASRTKNQAFAAAMEAARKLRAKEGGK